MRIERVQVEEGFLNGLDVELTAGLNVVIGERGTGKTSLIELIRFCLDIPGSTQESTKRSRDHARSVLEAGQVTVTLSEGARKITVSRTANDPKPRSSGPYQAPIIFSQTEIESIGLHAGGRLRLIDAFVQARRRRDDDEAACVAEIKSLCAEAATIRREVQDLDGQLLEIPSIAAQLSSLAQKENELIQVSASAASKKGELDEISERIAQRGVGITRTERLLQGLARWRSALSTAANLAPEAEKGSSADDGLQAVWRDVQRIRDQTLQFIQDLTNAESATTEVVRRATEVKLADEGQARSLRKEIERLQGGAGAVTSAGQQLRERKAQLESIQQLAEARTSHLATLLARRTGALDRLDTIRDERFLARQEAVKLLNNVLGPRIRLAVRRGGQFDSYASTVADILKGSGLRYGDLSQQIAQRASPRELMEAADQNSVASFSQLAEITEDRAARLLAQVQSSDLGVLATVLVDDDVQLQLLDGTVFKDIADLSTGQRCTVVLPIVLRHTDRILIVDQPEDHIDNAFIAETLIRAIIARSEEGQILFSTHNANIPVLGNADRVIQLGSDGKRGFVVRAAQLEDAHIIGAITTVMEGGPDAFNRRAAFYSKNFCI